MGDKIFRFGVGWPAGRFRGLDRFAHGLAWAAVKAVAVMLRRLALPYVMMKAAR